MGLSRKKILAFLAVSALLGGAMFVCTAQARTAKEEKSPLFNSDLSYDNQFDLDKGSDENTGTGELFSRMILMVLLVVFLGAAAIYISKKLVPRFTQLSGKKVRVIETVHLGPRKALHLLQIGDRQLLIGSTNENITRLADVTDELAEMDLTANQINNN